MLEYFTDLRLNGPSISKALGVSSLATNLHDQKCVWPVWFLTRPKEVHTSQRLKVGLFTPTFLGGNSYLSWLYDRGAIKDSAHTGTNTGLSQAINRGPIRKFLPKYANVYVTIQNHGLSAGARTHYVTANGVRNGLVPYLVAWPTPLRYIVKEKRRQGCDASLSAGM